ncbi:CAP domain-containing protein [Pseudoruegeria sp. HB172150]|uniref:CAP domain-containing protein n=1 Tax=Pseudoruegeria sp. HB172150 TaxID=2721164 RepID=UPI0015555B01|nr:CAP domain-containing protein [Pseudoruegeria sp. HB172150]
MRVFLLLVTGAFLLAGCGAPPPGASAYGGQDVYRLSNINQGPAQLRMLDGINALRSASGLPEVALDSSLNAAAETHSRDMARQNRPWHFSSDGSSPVERVLRAGYDKQMLGENISETYETELETLAAWMEQPDTRNVIMNRDAEDLGFAFYQDNAGKIWWTLVMGGGGPAVNLSPAPPAVTAPPGELPFG